MWQVAMDRKLLSVALAATEIETISDTRSHKVSSPLRIDGFKVQRNMGSPGYKLVELSLV